MTEALTIHQCDVTFADGTSSFFVSADGRTYFEHGFPEKGARTSPLTYSRDFLKAAAQGSPMIQTIEFTERQAVRESEVEAL